MDWNILKNNWALAIAAFVAAMVTLVVVVHVIKRSAWGRLRESRLMLRKARQHEAKAQKSVDKAERIARRLHQNADRTKPRHLEEAKEALQDARALAKIANDRILVAENHVRRVIHDEYPPARHEALRQKYLPEPARDRKPFSFE